MTRINVGIPPKSLSRQHLLAEHREIKRIPNMVASGKAKLGNIPKEFKLGKGSVRFFYNKLGYLKNRYEEIYAECLERKYNVTYYGNAWGQVPPELMGDFVPTKANIKELEQRIKERSERI